MPGFVALRIADQLRHARDHLGMDQFAFLQIDGERIKLIDHIGACERILSAPLPRAYTIHIRRFVLLYLTTLPFAMIDRVGLWTPLFTILVAYPILSLDQIGMELQNPFSTANIGHLPLDELCTKIERNLLALLDDEPGSPDGTPVDLPGDGEYRRTRGAAGTSPSVGRLDDARSTRRDGLDGREVGPLQSGGSRTSKSTTGSPTVT